MLKRLATFLEHHTSQTGPTPFAPARLKLTDAEALELLGSVEPAELRHGETVAAILPKVTEDLTAEVPEEADAIEAWAIRRAFASRLLWEQIEGEVIHGVEILRKRA